MHLKRTNLVLNAYKTLLKLRTIHVKNAYNTCPKHIQNAFKEYKTCSKCTQNTSQIAYNIIANAYNTCPKHILNAFKVYKSCSKCIQNTSQIAYNTC